MGVHAPPNLDGPPVPQAAGGQCRGAEAARPLGKQVACRCPESVHAFADMPDPNRSLFGRWGKAMAVG